VLDEAGCVKLTRRLRAPTLNLLPNLITLRQEQAIESVYKLTLTKWFGAGTDGSAQVSSRATSERVVAQTREGFVKRPMSEDLHERLKVLARRGNTVDAVVPDGTSPHEPASETNVGAENAIVRLDKKTQHQIVTETKNLAESRVGDFIGDAQVPEMHLHRCGGSSEFRHGAVLAVVEQDPIEQDKEVVR